MREVDPRLQTFENRLWAITSQIDFAASLAAVGGRDRRTVPDRPPRPPPPPPPNASDGRRPGRAAGGDDRPDPASNGGGVPPPGAPATTPTLILAALAALLSAILVLRRGRSASNVAAAAAAAAASAAAAAGSGAPSAEGGAGPVRTVPKIVPKEEGGEEGEEEGKKEEEDSSFARPLTGDVLVRKLRGEEEEEDSSAARPPTGDVVVRKLRGEGGEEGGEGPGDEAGTSQTAVSTLTEDTGPGTTATSLSAAPTEIVSHRRADGNNGGGSEVPCGAPADSETPVASERGVVAGEVHEPEERSVPTGTGEVEEKNVHARNVSQERPSSKAAHDEVPKPQNEGLTGRDSIQQAVEGKSSTGRGGNRTDELEGVRSSKSLFAKAKIPAKKAEGEDSQPVARRANGTRPQGPERRSKSAFSGDKMNRISVKKDVGRRRSRSVFSKDRPKPEQVGRQSRVLKKAPYPSRTMFKTRSRSSSPPAKRQAQRTLFEPCPHPKGKRKAVGVSSKPKSSIAKTSSTKKSLSKANVQARAASGVQSENTLPQQSINATRMSNFTEEDPRKKRRSSDQHATGTDKSSGFVLPVDLTFNDPGSPNEGDDELTFDTMLTNTTYTLKTNGGFQRIMDEIQQMQSERESLQAELDAIKSKLDGARAREGLDSDNLRIELNGARQELDKTKSIVAQLELDKERLEGALEIANEEVQDVQTQFLSFQSEANATFADMEVFLAKNAQLQSELDKLKSERTEAHDSLRVLREKQEECIAWEARMNAVSGEYERLKKQYAKNIEQMEEEHRQEVDAMKFTIRVMRGRMLGLTEGDDCSLSLDLGGQDLVGQEAYIFDPNSCDVSDPAVARAMIESREEKISDLESRLVAAEQERRRMHNQMQELRGNIRVFVRVRPFVSSVDDFCSDASLTSPITFFPGKEKLIISNRAGNEDLEFSYDKVFNPSAGQGVVFDEVSGLVQSAIDGYNVCIFSYGQTGSGKTHTMLGSGSGDIRGIIPRAVEQILSQVRVRRTQNWEFHVKASFLEIYNETLRDLLALDGGNSAKLVIMKDEYGRTLVDGLSCVDIDSADEVRSTEQLSTLMCAAGRSRSVALTKMNIESSRSHSVFILEILGFNEDTGTIINGSLNLCDLAGSERLKISKMDIASPIRLKETQSINKSLSSLSDVFNALAAGSPHIPYRNSKLTHLLQDCFSGDGKALMIVNLSPTAASCNESVCSLKFAKRVNKIELGRAVKHVMTKS